MSVPKNMADAQRKNARGADALDGVRRAKSAAARIDADAADARYRDKAAGKQRVSANAFDKGTTRTT